MKKVPAGLFLWEIHFMSSYYDGESTVPVDERFFILAKTYNEAMKKAEPSVARCQKRYKKGEVKTSVISLENLVPTRDSSKDGRLGWISTKALSRVELSLEEDKKHFRIAVCVVSTE